MQDFPPIEIGKNGRFFFPKNERQHLANAEVNAVPSRYAAHDLAWGDTTSWEAKSSS